MQTPLARRKLLVSMGLQEAIPHVSLRRQWQFIDDRAPPEGEADGEFRSHLDWIHHAASYIGWTGAKCFDAKDRPCRDGGDFARAKDEDAFPVRWYWPHRFPAGEPLPDRMFDLLKALFKNAETGIDSAALATSLGLKTLRSIPVAKAVELGWAVESDGMLRPTEAGLERAQREARCRMRAHCERPNG